MTRYFNDNEDYLMHHGIKGQHWGVRRYQNADGTLTAAGQKRQAKFEKTRTKQIKKVNSMYDHANKWTNRKVTKLDRKGKTAKADVMRTMASKNEQARKEKVGALKKMDINQYKKARRLDFMDYWGGGQQYMKENAASMTRFTTRLNEYDIQRGMRWASNFTLNSTLARMPANEGYDYLRRKTIANRAYSSGYNSGKRAVGTQVIYV